MKIGIFDSGLGGLIIAKAIFKKLPRYDYIYLGDTKNLPYGDKPAKQIFRLTQKAVDFLFKSGCGLVILACNTSSALALRKIQQQYLTKNYPNRRVLGVIVPTLEAADQNKTQKRIAVIATAATVKSHIYRTELKKLDKQASVLEIATPELVKLIEKNALPEAENALKLYLKSLKKIESLILGCTHYPIIKSRVKKIVGKDIPVISQDEIIPSKLSAYLKRHAEILEKLSKNSRREFYVTALNTEFKQVAKYLFGKKLNFKIAKI